MDEGLIVERVQGVAARAEIRPGDAILALVIAGKQSRLSSIEEFNRLVGGIQVDQQVTLLVKRGDATSYVSVRAGK